MSASVKITLTDWLSYSKSRLLTKCILKWCRQLNGLLQEHQYMAIRTAEIIIYNILGFLEVSVLKHAWERWNDYSWC